MPPAVDVTERTRRAGMDRIGLPEPRGASASFLTSVKELAGTRLGRELLGRTHLRRAGSKGRLGSHTPRAPQRSMLLRTTRRLFPSRHLFVQPLASQRFVRFFWRPYCTPAGSNRCHPVSLGSIFVHPRAMTTSALIGHAP